jgi:hypothetical protein
VEDIEDSIKVSSPSCDFVFVAPCVEGSRDRVSLAPDGDLPLDLSHSSAIETVVSRLSCVRTSGSTHPVSSPIASSTDRLSSSDRLPFNPRSRA